MGKGPTFAVEIKITTKPLTQTTMKTQTAKNVFFTESGKGYTQADVYSLCDYFQRTGNLDKEMSDSDMDKFEARYLSEEADDSIDPVGGYGAQSHI